jgi:immune inhibitor A
MLAIILAFLFCMPPKPGDYKRPVRMPRFPKLVNKPEPFKAPVVGTARGIALLVYFVDNVRIHDKSSFQTLLFGENSGSMKDYYHEVSYNKLTVEGEVSKWHLAPHSYSYYVYEGYGIEARYPNNVQKLVEDVVKLADPFIDFAQYDNDGNGYVDDLFIVHAGPGAEETGDSTDIWSHKWGLGDTSMGCPGPYLTADGVYINVYAMQPERFSNGWLITRGVFCHEFGHVLGLPDLYDTDYSSDGIGDFCLMSSGSWVGDLPGSEPSHLCIWAKYHLGWIDPIPVERGNTSFIMEANIPNIEQNSVAYRLLANTDGPDWSWNGGSGEYFLIENRQEMEFVGGTQGAGLLIFHIDESQIDGNDVDSLPLVGILQADGDPAFVVDDGGTPSDMWYSDTAGVTNLTVPSTALYDKTPSGASIINISASASTMTADLAVESLLLGRVYSYPNPFIKTEPNSKVTIRYVPIYIEEAAGETPPFKVTVFNLAGELVRILDDSNEIDQINRKAYWDGESDNGEDVASGLYFYIIETENEKNKGRFTFVR